AKSALPTDMREDPFHSYASSSWLTF
ncbi:MAG: hypothetical protein QOE04_621, partial [Mycobacterium sp.]|nr:hypothetical protein [Mycobacterium sp.]